MSDRQNDRTKDLPDRAKDLARGRPGRPRGPVGPIATIGKTIRPPADPIAHYIRKAGAAYSYGLAPNGDGMETPAEVLAELRGRFATVLLQLLPHTPKGTVSLPLLSGIVGPETSARRLVNGTATAHEYRAAIPAMLAHILGIHDTLHDLERECWVLTQLAHDPRIGGNKAYAGLGDEERGGVQRRVARHRLRKALLAGKKAQMQPTVYMPTRLVQIERQTDRQNEAGTRGAKE